MIPLKVLFVEDDRVDQLAFQRFVEERGLPITYTLAGSVTEAKSLVTQGEFDLIVADYSLGDGTTLDLLPFAQGIPLILLTGVGDEEIASRAFTAGISDYLVKDIGRNYLEQLPERMEKAAGKRMRSGEVLRESEERYRRILDLSQEGIWVLDEQFRTTFVNAQISKWLGYPSEEIVGHPVVEFLFNEDIPNHQQEMREHKMKADSQYEQRFQRKDGGAVWAIVSAKVISRDDRFQGSFAMLTDITERKKTEEALRESEVKYRLLADHMEDQMWLMDLNLKPIYISPSVEKIRGFTFEEIAQLPLDKQLTPASLQAAMEFFSIEMPKALADPTYFARSLELEFYRKDSSTIWVETMFSLIWDENGNPLSILGVGRDITDRKKAEEALRESEERYRRILDLSREGIWVLDEQFRTTFVNSQMSQWLGYPLEEIVGHPMEEFLFQEDVPDHQREMRERKMMIDSQYERRFQRKDGSVVWAIVSAKAISRDDRFQGSFAMLTDITERKQAEEALRESEAQYRLLADHMKDQVWLMDLNLKPTYVSPSVEKMRGYTFEEIAQLPLDKQLAPTSFQTAIEFFSIEWPKVLADPTYFTHSLELEFCCKDGSTLWLENMFSLIRDENGMPLSLLAVGRDITERKKTEEALQKSEEMYRVLVENAGEALVVAQDGMLRFVNPKAEEVTGFSQAELTSVPFLELIHPEDRALVGLNYQRRMRGEPAEDAYQFRIVCKNGTDKWVEIHAVLISWQGATATLNFLTDITERRRGEEALVETHQKLRQSLDSTILVLAAVAEMRDPYTAGHQQRVSELAQAIAQELDLSEEQVEGIRVAGLLHDVGKMQIPAEILSKPGKLTSVELMLIRTHSQAGYDILKSTVFPWPIAKFVLQHHERWDGSGYPSGLKGEEISLEGRILAVADVVEAMSSHRPYRPAFEAHEALWEILQNKGTLYDVAVAEACQRVFEERRFRFRSQVG